MDAAQALADLTEISSQIDSAVLLDADGALLGSTLADGEQARRIGDGAARLLEAARTAETGRDRGSLTQVQAATPEGSVFVVCESGRTIVGRTAPGPTVGLVLYDLRSCLRALDATPGTDTRPEPEPEKPVTEAPPGPEPAAEAKPKRSRRKASEAGGPA